MPYAEGRTYNDADSHVMETRDWLANYIDPRLRDRLPPPDFARTGRMADAIGETRDAAHWASMNLEANLMNCGVLMLLYGNAPPSWVRAQLLRYSKLERRRDEPLRLKTIVLGPPAPKADIAWSGSFERIDCQDGDIEQRVRGILDGLRL